MKPSFAFLVACMLCAMFHSNSVEAQARGPKPKKSSATRLTGDDWYVCDVIRDASRCSFFRIDQKNKKQIRRVNNAKLTKTQVTAVTRVRDAVHLIIEKALPPDHSCSIMLRPFLFSQTVGKVVTVTIGTDAELQNCPFEQEDGLLIELRIAVSHIHWLDTPYRPESEKEKEVKTL